MRRKKMLSIIIPKYKSEKTIKECIASINNSSFKSFEVIMVDGSKGAGIARNIGVRKAKGDIVLFLDSDVVVHPNTIEKINNSFKNDISALQCMYSKKCPIKNFYSQYQNLYHYYMFNSIKSKYIQTASTYCFAIRKEEFIDFSNIKTVEDGEWGIKLYQKGKKILLDKDIQVEHLKRYTLISLLKRSFITSSNKINSIKKNKKQININLDSTHHNKIKMFSILFSVVPPVFWYLNRGFFRFIYKEKGKVFLLKTILFHEINYFVFLVGIIKGVIC